MAHSAFRLRSAARGALLRYRRPTLPASNPPFGLASAFSAQTAASDEVFLTESAVQQLHRLAEEHGEVRLRLSVEGGGCSGFQYVFDLDSVEGGEERDGDRVFSRDGATLVVDDVSLEFVQGAKITYETSLMSEAFAVENPNAESACGCGSSFQWREEY